MHGQEIRGKPQLLEIAIPLLSPVFFTMVAKKGSHLGVFALGLLFALTALWAGFSI